MRRICPNDMRVARTKRRGSVLMEFVMTMPLLMMLVMLVLQFALIVTARQLVAYAAFCAARSTLSANDREGGGGGLFGGTTGSGLDDEPGIE